LLFIGASKRGEAPLSFSSPTPSKERGIKGVRSILISQRALSIYSEPVELAKILPEGMFS
jgi:hypothetical protein